MFRGHVQERVSSHVNNIHLGPTYKEGIDDVRVAMNAGIMERSESMLVTVWMSSEGGEGLGDSRYVDVIVRV